MAIFKKRTTKPVKVLSATTFEEYWDLSDEDKKKWIRGMLEGFAPEKEKKSK
jgi:hypothetical protein